jgi:two-component system response regulator FixJ
MLVGVALLCGGLALIAAGNALWQLGVVFAVLVGLGSVMTGPSGHADVPMAVAGIKAGAQDFIEKPVDDAELVAAINRCLMRVMQRPAPADATSPVAERFKRLTPRQVEVFDLVAEGFTSVAIAAKLQISQRTVESYRAEVMEKMQAESVAVLVRQAIRLGRVTP